MPYTPTPQTIVQADVDALKVAVQAVLTQIATMNNTATALTAQERREGVTVAVNRQPFNDYYFLNKNNFPNLKPAVADTLVPEADADQHYFIQKSLDESTLLLKQALENVSDMQLNSEHFSFNYANGGRNTALRARKNGKPDADAWANSLNDLYPQLGPHNPQANP